MTREWINFSLAVAMLTNAVGLALTGTLLRWAVPAGPSRGGQRGAFLWHTPQHWRDLHLDLALLFIGLIIVHLLLHRRWIARRLQELSRRE